MREPSDILKDLLNIHVNQNDIISVDKGERLREIVIRQFKRSDAERSNWHVEISERDIEKLEAYNPGIIKLADEFIVITIQQRYAKLGMMIKTRRIPRL